MVEVYFDGLIGPTYHFGGHSPDNLASTENRQEKSYPKRAALQGLYKMKVLADLGVRQAVLPPQERPSTEILRRLGFDGTDGDVIEQAHALAPNMLLACCSASSAWAANGASVSPSSDCADERVHFTAANLTTLFHRSLEPWATRNLLEGIFPDPEFFAHHDPLPSHPLLGDEGSANQIRLYGSPGGPGVTLFVYGRAESGPVPMRYAARQSLLASQALARLHLLIEDQTVFAQQAPSLIDEGIFHNDLVAMGNGSLLVLHERAYLNCEKVLLELQDKFEAVCGGELQTVVLQDQDITIPDLVRSYILNSQLVARPDGKMILIAPDTCKEDLAAQRVILKLLHARAIAKVLYFDLSESMRNGGGPACLTLRVTLNSDEFKASHRALLLDDALYGSLVDWINDYYPDELTADALGNPDLLFVARQALDTLTEILDLGPLYPFQQ